MTEKCIELVKKFEGFSSVVYLCPAGYPTIGYGHVVIPEEKEKFEKGITKQEAEELLIKDLLKIEKLIKPMIEVKIHDYMIDALISFAFNVGVYAFKASTLRRKLNRGEFYSAAEEFPKWRFAGGKELKGLLRRRLAEKALFEEGIKLI